MKTLKLIIALIMVSSVTFGQFTITGSIKYANNAATPLDGLKIILSAGGTREREYITTSSGTYGFYGLADGIYDIEIQSAAGTWQTWAGVNNTDYLLVTRHVQGVMLLLEMPPVVRIAADVFTPHPDITIEDANKIRQAVITISGWGKFDIPKWVFSGETTGLSGIVVNHNIIMNIKGLCAGDVNGSYLPQPGNK